MSCLNRKFGPAINFRCEKMRENVKAITPSRSGVDCDVEKKEESEGM